MNENNENELHDNFPSKRINLVSMSDSLEVKEPPQSISDKQVDSVLQLKQLTS